ncbi:HNH endonuclease signature motif containing protein [Nocardioides limicola]|uniref:HNH endonuclease signature motif containing protein n=1 Tax=Nocardioides limicola TaxID=2803368 RepID=UPI00193B87B6|nr:HNH endonuclease signature motif containing protein [Nocardioides sp. DJM-14]
MYSEVLTHPLIECVAVVEEALAGAVGCEPLYLPTPAKAEVLARLVGVRSRLDGLLLRVMAGAGEVAESVGARDVGGWLAAETRQDVRAAKADARLAAELDRRWVATGAALSSGMVSLEQARVIAAVLGEVAEDLDAEDLVKAEAVMVEEASRLDPRALRALGRHLVRVVNPEKADEAEARRQAETDEHAAGRSRLTLREVGDGTMRITGVVPESVGRRLSAYLEAFAQPRKQAAAADGRRVPRPKLLADALRDLLERLDPAGLPAHGGDATTVIITMDLDRLRAGVGAAGLGWDGDVGMSAAEVRRLACQAALIPMVLGSGSEVLDVGRKSRLHTPVQRKAIRLRDKHCRAEGCTVPAQWCDVHHPHAWSQGGGTSVANGMLLCSHHHHRSHDPGYDHTLLPDGSVRYHRRT